MPEILKIESYASEHADRFPCRRLAVERLRETYDRDRRLFSRQIRNGEWASTQGTEEITSTAICLIGLSRAGVSPNEIDLQLEETFSSLCGATRRQGYVGALGLSLWAHALYGAGGVEDVAAASGIDLQSLGGTFPTLTTMELAWLVSGLCHQAAAGDGRARDWLPEVLGGLVDRYSRNGRLFAHAAKGAPLAHRLRRRVANFADQIYPLQALALASLVTGDVEPRQIAADCAERLVALQGDLGQWWWHYDPKAGAVVGRYPVYAVHQHGMAPMAFNSLRAAGGPDLETAADRGRAWLTHNELGLNLIESTSGIIWRDIERSEGAMARRLRQLRALVGRPDRNQATPPEELRLNREIRPYEWGWLLFAQAMAEAAPGHLA